MGLLDPEPSSPSTPAASTEGAEVVPLDAARDAASARVRDAGSVGAGDAASLTSQVSGDGTASPQVGSSTGSGRAGDTGEPKVSSSFDVGDNLVELGDFRLNPAGKSTTGVLAHQDILARAHSQQTAMPAWSSLGSENDIIANQSGDSGGPLTHSAAHFVITPREDQPVLDLENVTARAPDSASADHAHAASPHARMAGMAARARAGRVVGHTTTGRALTLIGK